MGVIKSKKVLSRYKYGRKKEADRGNKIDFVDESFEQKI